MRLPKPFYRLPVRFDVERMRTEVSALSATAWVKHPNKIDGNSSVRLISVEGRENDDVKGVMLPTPHLQQAPYLRQILASFAVVWSRSRLMRLEPGAVVPEHADINHHWFSRVRMHIPVFTRPEVKFHCGGQTVHMAAGEAWLFDNWRPHRVENPTDDLRIHFVADTSGSAAFWQFVAQSESPNVAIREHRFDPSRNAVPLTERTLPPLVMPPAEVDLLVMDLRGELALREDSPAGRTQLARYHGLLDGFCRDWRQLYLLYGEHAAGRQEYARMLDGLRAASRTLAEGLMTRTNSVAAHMVLEGRLLGHLLNLPNETAAQPARNTPPRTATPVEPRQLKQPLFIVAAPRSGSTLLFETLATTPQLHTLGGEAHWLVEGIPELRPGAPGVESNRLNAGHRTDSVARQIMQSVSNKLQNSEGQPVNPAAEVRWLEKTPKNALRIPFFDAIFPDARFVFLWRDPRECLGSIIEAWLSGNWQTYPALDDWDGPWSLLLPPGWRVLRGKALEEIAAYQWDCTNRIVLDDLANLTRDRWTSLGYSELVSRPEETIRRLCEFARIEFDATLAQRVSAPLPLSRYTQTPPADGKWRKHEATILRILPGVESTWQRLQALERQSPNR